MPNLADKTLRLVKGYSSSAVLLSLPVVPKEVRGLVLAVKACERAIIDASVTGSTSLAAKAMLLRPSIGEWEPSKELLSNFRLKKPVVFQG